MPKLQILIFLNNSSYFQRKTYVDYQKKENFIPLGAV